MADTEREYDRQDMLHILRNPWNWSDEVVRQARLDAADRIEELERVATEAVRQRDEGWALAKRYGKELAELKYPGMTTPIRALDLSRPPNCPNCGAPERPDVLLELANAPCGACDDEREVLTFTGNAPCPGCAVHRESKS